MKVENGKFHYMKKKKKNNSPQENSQQVCFMLVLKQNMLKDESIHIYELNGSCDREIILVLHSGGN